MTLTPDPPPSTTTTITCARLCPGLAAQEERAEEAASTASLMSFLLPLQTYEARSQSRRGEREERLTCPMSSLLCERTGTDKPESLLTCLPPTKSLFVLST